MYTYLSFLLICIFNIIKTKLKNKIYNTISGKVNGKPLYYHSQAVMQERGVSGTNNGRSDCLCSEIVLVEQNSLVWGYADVSSSINSHLLRLSSSLISFLFKCTNCRLRKADDFAAVMSLTWKETVESHDRLQPEKITQLKIMISLKTTPCARMMWSMY